ncbi:MAG TPA: hypothetical protein VG934_02870 [Candidatus Paceibacterota bacterium]|nr:hypothetical protein [Candidatus Paceibacterota bacterium]
MQKETAGASWTRRRLVASGVLPRPQETRRVGAFGSLDLPFARMLPLSLLGGPPLFVRDGYDHSVAAAARLGAQLLLACGHRTSCCLLQESK